MADPQTVVTQTGGAASAFGKYTLVRKLADGGMAEIFLAKQIGAGGFERNVVIKKILPNLSSHAEFVGMFLDEARLAARFSHPNVVQVTDAGLADGAYYLCMEYLAGEDFATVLRLAAQQGKQAPLGVCIRVVIEAANGLHYAHEFTDESGMPLQVVHRDVSPSNIFVTYQGPVKVLDFGIAKAESRATHTRSGTVKGKFVYMSPEQVRGGNVDRRSDVFALGIVLYEALTGIRPFARENDLAVMNAILRSEVKPLRELRPDLPEDIETVVSQAMALDPDERYPTAAALAHDLERFLTRVSAETTTHEIGRYVRALFGEERMASRTRIPTLEKLLAAGVTLRGFTDPNVPKVTSPSNPAAASKAPPQEMATHDVPLRGKSKKAAWYKAPWALMAAAVVVVGVGVATGLGIANNSMPGEEAAPPAPAVAANTNPTPPPAPVPTPPAPTPPVNAAALTTTPPTETPAPVAKPTTTNRPRPPRPPKDGPIRLDINQIQKVVTRSQSSIAQCFETHKGDLGGQSGAVKIQFTILGSGKVVNSHAMGPLATSGVGTCLAERVSALKFPEHVDQGITLELPFAYRVER